jgi:hypothetical protein
MICKSLMCIGNTAADAKPKPNAERQKRYHRCSAKKKWMPGTENENGYRAKRKRGTRL